MKTNLSSSVQALRNRKQNGFTLIELLLVLGVGAIIIAGAVLLYQSATASNQNQTETGNLAATVASTHTMFLGKQTYTGLSNTVLAHANGFPAAMMSTATQPINSWGGYVTALPAASGFSITYAAVPAAACSNLVAGNAGAFYGIMSAASTAATDATATAIGAGVVTSASTAANIDTLCQINAGGKVDLTFYSL